MQKNSKKKIIPVIAVIMIIAIAAAAVLIMRNSKDKNPETDDSMIKGNHKIVIDTGETVTGVMDYSNSNVSQAANISVPGYDTFYFKAGTKEQDVELNNPKDNTCYFVMTLSLEDGTEIWKSDYLEPGVMYDHITLEKELEEGTYENVTLNYDCYALNDMHVLNGAVIQLSLDVK